MLTRWEPIAIHRAILGGATPTEVCAAFGASMLEVLDGWQRWVEVQRHLMINACPAVCEEAYIRVLRFANACKGPLR